MTLKGGKKTKNIVSNILRDIFTNELAQQYNWTGKHGKKPLKDFKIFTVLRRK